MTRNPSRWALLMTAAVLGPSLIAGAEVPPIEGVWASVATDHAMLADPLWGLEPGSRGELAALLPDEETGSASVGKSWALHMAHHALDQGLVTEDEIITIGPSAMARPFNWVVDTSGQRMAQREQFRFWDAVMGSYVRSANDLTTAYTEHIGLKLAQAEGDTCSFAEPYPSGCMQRFLDWSDAHMHGPAGVSATTVYNRPYIADNTTARDVLRWWVHALEDPRFVEDASFAGTYAFSSLPPFSKNYAPGRTAPNIVGFEAWKDGATGKCNGDIQGGNGCRVSSAVRIGRRLVASTHQSLVTPDTQALYDWGFAKTFHPEPAGQSQPWAPVQAHAVACVSGSKAVSATIKANGVPRLVLWDVDMEAPSITTATEANPALLPGNLDLKAWAPPNSISLLNLPVGQPGAPQAVNRALAGAPDPSLPPAPPLPIRNPPALPVGPPTLGLPETPLGEVVAVDVVPLGSTAFVALQRSVAATQLSTWGINGQALVPLGSTAFPTPGVVHAQLLGLTGNRFLLALHESDGDLRFQSWQALGNGALVLVQSSTTSPVAEFDLAVQPHLGDPLVFVAARTLGDGIRTEVWRMNHDGSLDFLQSGAVHAMAQGIAASAAPVEPAGGFFIEPHFAMAFQDEDGWARLAYWSWDGLQLQRRSTTTISPQPLPEGTVLDLEPLGSSGLLLAKQVPGIAVDLDVFESRRDTPDVQPLFVVGNQVQPVGEFRGLCKVPRPVAGAPSEGDYLLATDEFFGGALQVSGWRSGERPH